MTVPLDFWDNTGTVSAHILTSVSSSAWRLRTRWDCSTTAVPSSRRASSACRFPPRRSCTSGPKGSGSTRSSTGRPSRRIAWRDVLEFAPEVIVLTCCGFSLERGEAEADLLRRYDGFADLPAARSGRVFASAGSAYFTRPGPRIVDSLEILAHLVHPEIFPAPPLDRAFAPVLTAPAPTGPAAR